MSSNVNLLSILDNNKLIGPSFLNWFKNPKIVLKAEKIAYVLNRRLLKSPLADASASDQNVYQKHIADSEITSCIMHTSMTTKLQMHHETMESYDIIIHLRELFEKHARFERFEISKLLFSTKMQVGTFPMQHEDEYLN